MSQNTRTKLLNKTAQEMLLHGYNGMRVDNILDKVGVAKGALYHHFRDKKQLGYAVVDEILRNRMNQRWIKPLQNSDEPIKTMISIIKGMIETPSRKLLLNGCPINNLAQEMSADDEGFRQRINDIYTTWRQAIADALKRGLSKKNS